MKTVTHGRRFEGGGEHLKLGILGGTFDPIHFGHLRLAEEVGEELELEKVYLIPAASPPHKKKRPVSPFCDRLATTRKAAEASPLLEAMDLEGRRQGHSYSIETLREFHRLYGPDLELYFILGMDAFLEIGTWKEYKNLFDYAHFVVINRPGVSGEVLDSFLSSFGVDFTRQNDHNRFAAPSGNLLIYKKITLMDISSTGIRDKVSKGKSIRFLVPESVMAYIKAKGLYTAHGDA